MIKYIAAVFIFTTSFMAKSQNSVDRLQKFEDTYQNSKQIVNRQNLRIDFNLVYGNGKRQILDTSSNTLVLSNSSSQGRLNILSSKDAPIVLDGAVENYKVKFDDDRKQIVISYNLMIQNQKHDINIGIKPNGIVELVTSQNGAKGLSWRGSLSQ